MEITFLGAAKNVTGSKHLIQTENYNLLLDCGFFQGKRKEANEQNKNLPFNEKSINAVILSHAHLDHCGSLPILVKNGFSGKIYCTKATAQIAKFILLDSANIQKTDAEYLNKHIKNESDFVSPIYTEEDVNKTLEYFEPIEYLEWISLNKDIRFKFYDAGHILGSAITILEIKENDATKNLAFTGDLGRKSAPILEDPQVVVEKVEFLISECTYGDRLHQPIAEAQKDLADVILKTADDKGKILIPAFSLGRAQEMVYLLHKLSDEKKIPELPIYIDSPLTTNITEIFKNNTEYFDDDFRRNFSDDGQSPFESKNIIYTKTVEESKALNKKPGPFIIIAGSGMAEGGRILHHLKNNIGDERNTILIVGYQAENTLGRRLQDGVSPAKIYGQYYEVKAKVKTLGEFSAHADQKELLDYMASLKGLEEIFLVHTEEKQIESFVPLLKNLLPNISIEVPQQGQSFEI